MTGPLQKLLSISSDALIGSVPMSPVPLLKDAGPVGQDLWSLLTRKNGFYAFESALRVFPIGAVEGVMDLESWNSGDLWRRLYADSTKGCVFFAEDIFGGQFCIREDRVTSFDPETGDLKTIARSLAQWAELILDRYNVLTGFPLAHEWQQRNGSLAPNQRLVPKTPFVLGGQYAVDNLHAVDAVDGMRLRADIARQIRHLPDGAKVKLIVK
jgi:hypothetical protein